MNSPGYTGSVNYIVLCLTSLRRMFYFKPNFHSIYTQYGLHNLPSELFITVMLSGVLKGYEFFF